MPHCGHPPQLNLQYTILFPFSEHPEAAKLGLSFEIDKVNKRFKTIGVDAEEATGDSLDGLVDDFQASALTDNEDEAEDEENNNKGLKSTKTVERISNFLEDDENAIDFVGFCVSNKLCWARNVYGKSPQQSRLVVEKDKAGNTVLSMTAMDGHDEVVEFLLEKGAKVHTVNAKGRTPLMEAALWGRSAVVKRLMSHGASVNDKDREGRPALDLAKDCRRNEEERASRSRMYSGNLDKRQQRRIITALLGGSFSHSSRISKTTIGKAAPARIYRSGVPGISSTYTLLTSAIEMPVENFHKTVAFLNRGGSFPVVRAKSGWSNITEDPDYLDSFHWTNEVFKVCKTIRHKVSPDKYDGAEPGMFNACHAEKQLMAFFAHKHRFAKEELDEDEDLAKLSLVHSPRRLKEATILVSTPICDDCEAFRVAFQRYFKVSIDIQYLQTAN